MVIRSCFPISLIAIGLLFLVSCRNSEPVRIGFVGGITGRVADLGVAGRNGAQLAVEQRNAAGGIHGKPVELMVKDDGQDVETAKRVTAELIAQNVELIIGPMTSSIAMAIMPQINASKSILLSPTVTTTDLSGKDDSFLRVIAATTSYASKNADYLYEKLGARTVAAVYDASNKSYSESWLNDFRTAFEKRGGKIVLLKSFQSGTDVIFQPLVQELLAARADTVLIVSNAVDSSLICQQVRKLAPQQRIAMSEWASTERFIELAGRSSEGLIVSQFLDRNDTSKRFQDFLTAYRARFKQEPGFAGVAGYDAALVAMEAYASRKQNENLKGVILGMKRFQGVQQPLNIDGFGDADRKTFVTTIRNNQFVTVE